MEVEVSIADCFVDDFFIRLQIGSQRCEDAGKLFLCVGGLGAKAQSQRQDGERDSLSREFQTNSVCFDYA